MRDNTFKKYYSFLNSGTSAFKFANRPSFPILIDIELTNMCNFKCCMCETGMGTSIRTKGMMSDKIYHKILHESAPHKPALRFIRWGEPTLHPSFLEYLIEAKSMGFPVHFNTNGYALSESMMKAVVDHQVDSIKFSFQGADRTSYREMRGIDFFEELFEKIAILVDIRESRGGGDGGFPFIQVSTTLTDEADEQIAYFKKKASVADYFNIGKTNMALVKVDRLRPKEATMVENLRKRTYSLVRVKQKTCSEVFAKLSIDWDGSVTACCSDNNNQLKVGDLNSQSLQSIFQSERMLRLQAALAEDRFDINPLCATCAER
jgi:radical SAM protein with 4Fe4S-binding SPASM domain